MSVLDLLRPVMSAGKRYGPAWLKGSIAGHVAGGAGGGILGYLTGDDDNRLMHAAIGAGLGWQLGGPIGALTHAGPMIARDADAAIRARTAANDMSALDRLESLRGPRHRDWERYPDPTRARKPSLRTPEDRKRYEDTLYPPNSNMAGWEEAISGVSRGRPFDDAQIIAELGPNDELIFSRPSAESYAQGRWGMNPDLAFAPPSSYEEALAAQHRAQRSHSPKGDELAPGSPVDLTHILTPEILARLRAAGLIQ